MENNPTWILVVAGAFARDDGRWLMHQRPKDAHHGGLWEFPGGKVESGETPEIALIREIKEELGLTIRAADCVPAAFAQTDRNASEPQIVILLYNIANWTGKPEALEGGSVDWFAPEEIHALAKPPLDVELARQLFGESER